MRILPLILLSALAQLFGMDSGLDLGLGPQPVSAGKSADTSKVNGTTLGTTSATAGTFLGGSGSDIRSLTLSGDGTIDGTGVLTLGANATHITSGLLAAARGGLGVDGSSATNGFLPIGNGTGYTLAGLTAGNGLAITNAAGAITLKPKCYQLGSDCGAHSVTGTLSETVLKLISVNATTFPIPANSVIVIHTLWSYTNSSNAKNLRVKIGAAGSGTGGTAMFSGGFTTTASIGRDVVLFCRGTASQISFASVGSLHENTQTTAPTTAAIDMTANWEINATGILANTGETIQLEAIDAEVFTP